MPTNNDTRKRPLGQGTYEYEVYRVPPGEWQAIGELSTE